MAKDKSEKKDKKERKEKKEKRAEVDGVKKIKKEKKSKDVVKALEAELEQSSSPEPAQQVKVDPSGDVKMEDDLDSVEPSGALVPFANPLILDAKDLKKVLRTVKKCKFALHRCRSSFSSALESERSKQYADNGIP